MQRIGTQSGLFDGGNPATNTKGTVVTAAWLNAIQEEIAGTIEASGAALDAGSNAQLLAALDVFLRRDTRNIGVGGGTANALTAACTPPVTGLADGLRLIVRNTAAANSTTAPTFTPNSGVIAAKAIVKSNNKALAAGDTGGAAYWLELRYDAAIDKWVLLNPQTGINAYASDAEAQAQTVANKPISPATLATAMQGSNQNMALNGYQKLPGGLIIQWGQQTCSAAGPTTVSFPLTWPTGAWVMAGWVMSPNGGGKAGGAVLSTSQFNIASTSIGGSTYYADSVGWIAIGR